MLENSDLCMLSEILFDDEPEQIQYRIIKICLKNIIPKKILPCKLDSTINVLSFEPKESIQHLNDVSGPLKSPGCTEISMCNIDNVTNNLSPIDESAHNFTVNRGDTENNSGKSPMPSPGDSIAYFGEEAIPSISSLLSDSRLTSSPYPRSSNEPHTPKRSRKIERLREQFNEERVDSKRKVLKNSGKSYNSRDGKQRRGKT